MFNTLPSNSVAQEGGSGGTTTSTGVAPRIAGSSLPSYWSKSTHRFLEGFSDVTGSALYMPITSSDALTLYSSTGSILWTFANPGSTVTNYDHWVGFWLDTDGTKLYVVLVDSGTTPDTFALITIDSAGTVTTIGTDQPAVDFTARPTWMGGGTIIEDGAGNFKILSDLDSATNAQYAVMDATGTFTTQPTTFYTGAALAVDALPSYETTNGYVMALSNFGTTATGKVSIQLHNKTDLISNTFVPLDSLLGIGINSCGWVKWRDYVVSWDSVNSSRVACLKYTEEAMATFAQQLAEYAGIEK